ncbi:MAG: S8 family serine peptidase [Chloroflexota bacterium]
MKRLTMLFGLALIAVFVVGAVGSPAAFAGSGEGNARVLVQFVPGKKAAVQGALSSAGGETHFEFDALQTIAVTVPEAALAGLERNPNIVMIEEDALRYPVGINKSAYQAEGQTVPYGVDMVQARDVWDVNRDGTIDAGAPTGDNRTVCIIDSGFFTGHEDLAGVNVSGYDGNLPWDQDYSGHGTHVAGTIAAMNNTLGVVGVTPGTVNVYAVRVFGDDGAWAYSSTLIDAANRCEAAGANIISMSLSGGRPNNTERRGFDTLYANGILSVAAASNDGTTDLAYPASYDSVVSVGAIDSAKVVADFSNQNVQVELAAPGVGVLSTVPYLDATSLTVDGVTYAANHIEFSGRGATTEALVDGGLCLTTGAWAGQVVLCERGDISFYDKVMNVQNSGGTAAVIYNNEPGNFLGTLGDGASSAIIGISLSQEDGQFLVTNSLGHDGLVESYYTEQVSSYEYYDGTSMATPHVAAVAALVWSADITATNTQVRDALATTAEDLGAAGRDVAYGFGLVQAADAIAALGGGGGGGDDIAMHVEAMNGTVTSSNRRFWKASASVQIFDVDGAAVSGATVSGDWSYGGSASCVTDSTGWCTVKSDKIYDFSPVTFTVSGVTAAGYYYDAAANVVTLVTIPNP